MIEAALNLKMILSFNQGAPIVVAPHQQPMQLPLHGTQPLPLVQEERGDR